MADYSPTNGRAALTTASSPSELINNSPLLSTLHSTVGNRCRLIIPLCLEFPITQPSIKMREIVHIQAGQCGNQIGAKVIHLILLTYGKCQCHTRACPAHRWPLPVFGASCAIFALCCRPLPAKRPLTAFRQPIPSPAHLFLIWYLVSL